MTEFAQVVRRRRMTRAFDPRPVDRSTIESLVDLAARAPSAGKSQGWHFVALDGADTSIFWDATLPSERRDGFAFPDLLAAPTIIVPFADPQAYVQRYAESDKAATGLGHSAQDWPTPYWTVDTSMAIMTLLLAAEDRGLGALLFAVFSGEAELRRRLDIPDHWQLLGAIALGHPRNDPQHVPRSGRSASWPRQRALRWGTTQSP